MPRKKRKQRKSFLTCPHNNVQQFTEHCFDCGYNVYMTEEEYLRRLKEEIGETTILKLEKKLGIKR